MGGRGKGTRRREKGPGEWAIRPSAIPATLAPRRTRIESCEIQIINNDNEKKSDGHVSEKRETKSAQANPSDLVERGSEQEAARDSVANHPGNPLGPSAVADVLSLDRRTPIATPPEGTPSPSAQQRGRQPTNPVGLRGSPQAAPLPRSTCASPAASLLQSKQTP